MADPISLGAIASMASIGGAGMGVAGALQQGSASQAAANYQAQVNKQQAAQALAAGTRDSYEKNLQTDLVQSKQVADAAGSGAGVQTPTIADIYGQTASHLPPLTCPWWKHHQPLFEASTFVDCCLP